MRVLFFVLANLPTIAFAADPASDQVMDTAERVTSGSHDVWLIVLGAVLALGTSVAMEVWRIKFGDRQRRRALTSLLEHETSAISEALGRLQQDTNSLGYFPLLRLDEIINARQGFDRNRDWIILFDEDLRRRLFNFYRDVLTLVINIRGLETLKLEKSKALLVDTAFNANYINEKGRLLVQIGTLVTEATNLKTSLNRKK